jgi:uncharacterized protein
VGAPPLAAGAGIGLRAPHYGDIARRKPALAFLEVHSENFFGEGGPALAVLEGLRDDYALSFHGVGLSLGSADPLDARHLARLDALVRRFEPALVSEHLSWSSFGGIHANDLLPLPRTREAVDHVAGRIARVQERLKRRILVENVSCYLELGESALTEWEFVDAVVRRSGCALLLDVNNVHVNAVNQGFDARAWLASVDPSLVAEYHLAGHEHGERGLIDTHAAPVAPEVWALFREAVARMGPRPTLIERDACIPPLEVLLAEAGEASAILDTSLERLEAPA